MANEKWESFPSEAVLTKTIEALKNRGIEVLVAETGKEALEKMISIIPDGAEIANGSSTTLNQIGFVDYLIANPAKWKNLHEDVLKEKDPQKQADLRRKSDTAEYFLASINAISQNGELVACDASGSRVSAFPFAAKKLVLVASINKITENLDEAMRRVREYVYPLENERAQKAYGSPSQLGKWVIMEHDFPGRTTLILVKEKLGF